MRTQKLFALLATAIILAGVVVGCKPKPPANQDLLDQVMAAGKLRVASDANYAPQSFLSDDGTWTGFDVAVAEEVARRMGVELEIMHVDWDILTAGSWNGRWDLHIGSMTATEERAAVLWFTDPYYYTPAGFAVHVDNTSFTSPEDLGGTIIGVGTETTYERWLEKNLVIYIPGYEFEFGDWEAGEIRAYTSDPDAIQDLAIGDGVRLDAVMSAIPTIQSAIDEGQPVKLLGEPAFYEPLCFDLDKSRGESQKMLDKLNEIIAAMHADGTLRDLSMEFYGEDLTIDRSKE
jgi:polar amino acid transport system substrate-binding protein